MINPINCIGQTAYNRLTFRGDFKADFLKSKVSHTFDSFTKSLEDTSFVELPSKAAETIMKNKELDKIKILDANNIIHNNELVHYTQDGIPITVGEAPIISHEAGEMQLTEANNIVNHETNPFMDYTQDGNPIIHTDEISDVGDMPDVDITDVIDFFT